MFFSTETLNPSPWSSHSLAALTTAVILVLVLSFFPRALHPERKADVPMDHRVFLQAVSLGDQYSRCMETPDSERLCQHDFMLRCQQLFAGICPVREDELPVHPDDESYDDDAGSWRQDQPVLMNRDSLRTPI